MKASIIYHSVTGNTKKMAEIIAASMNTVEGMEVKAFPIENVDIEFAKESKCLIVGTPIYMSSTSAALHTWLQSGFFACAPSGKLGGAFSTANDVDGGGALGIRTILDGMLVCGMLTYSAGGSFGEPIIHLGPVGLNKHLDETEERFIAYGKRMALKTMELFG